MNAGQEIIHIVVVLKVLVEGDDFRSKTLINPPLLKIILERFYQFLKERGVPLITSTIILDIRHSETGHLLCR